MPWIAMVIATVALIIALVALNDRSTRTQPPLPFPSSFNSTFPVPEQPVDLSRLSPREAANRLFNRVMTASENGNTEEALRFAPMALAAYENLGDLDNDSRYHVALIHLTAGETDAVQVEIDKIRGSVPQHLLASMLEYQLAERRGDNAAAARAERSFLNAYEQEIAAGRSEYQEHSKGIERFRKAAQARSTR